MGPVLGSLPSEVVVGSGQLLQLPEPVGTCCKGCIQSSGLQGIICPVGGSETKCLTGELSVKVAGTPYSLLTLERLFWDP